MKSLLRMLALSILLFTTASTISAKAVTVSGDGFAQATRAIWNWLESLGNSLDSFVATTNRSQLRDKLHALNQAIYDVESAKLALLFEMKKTTGSETEVKRMQDIVADLTKKVDLLRESIHAVVILLRENGQIGGVKCEEMLSSAVSGRKEWLFNLAREPKLLEDASARRQIILDGEAAAASLREASLELAKVTSQLQSD